MSGFHFNFDSPGFPVFSASSQPPSTPNRLNSGTPGGGTLPNLTTGVNPPANAAPGSQSQPGAGPPLISPLAIDRLAQDMELDDKDRKKLHTFVSLATIDMTLSKADIITRLYILATILSEISERHRVAEAAKVHDLASLMADIRIRLQMTFVLMPEQKVWCSRSYIDLADELLAQTNIRARAMDLIIEPTRTSFKMYHVELKAALREDQNILLLTNVFGNPVREKILDVHTRRVCSNIRNTLREDLRDSVIGDSVVTLTRFVYGILYKFKRAAVDTQQEHGYTIHLALLRRFAIEHPELLNVVEIEEDDNSPGGDNDENTPPRKRRRTTRVHKTRGSGCPVNGKDFWSQVDEWFKKEVATRGTTLTAGGWKAYVKETIDLDNARFAPAAQGNRSSAATEQELCEVTNGGITAHQYGSADGGLACMLSGARLQAGNGLGVKMMGDRM
ncbi:predicted protein [Postia placenta Mad-698-R]|nr:predicted protein [Postia placenta Mad-698-R]